MKTDKKNQHYIPKFYLRNFSYKKNKKQIGIFKPDNKFYFQRAKLKTQGSQNFYYGEDGIVEDKLANIEGDLAKCIVNLTKSKELPKKLSSNHIILLTFVALTHLRNPVNIDNIKNIPKTFNDQIKSMGVKVSPSALMPEISHQEAIRLSLRNVPSVVESIIDLDYKLLVNKTSKPFISSDLPVIKYNSFLEQRKWAHSKTGYGSKGLQIIIPLNSEISIIFYDSMIYKVGTKKNKFLLLNEEDIKQLNILQFLNCYNTIFFDDSATENYLKKLNNDSSKFKKANQTESSLHHMIKSTGKQKFIIPNSNNPKNLVLAGTTDCEIGLNITGIKIHNKGKKSKLGSGVVELRANAIEKRKNYR